MIQTGIVWEDGLSEKTQLVSLDLIRLRQALGSDPGSLIPLLTSLYKQIESDSDPAIWICRIPWEQILARAESLLAVRSSGKGGEADLPLFGIPFAVKDNIDVAGFPTTAACPAFAYTPETSATVVTRLEAAGAILMGKTNMDQFATGLVGTRSPYGTVRNIFNPDYITGGSSSGSAAAVAAGLVSFALGTDTAGSGRIPAGFNNVVGLKPSRGLISTAGVVPACRTLDCISIFALTSSDASKILEIAQGPDEKDAFSRVGPVNSVARPSAFRFGVPDTKHLEFFGDTESAELFKQARLNLESIGGIPVEIDFAPFAEAAAMLYQGPWLAERQAAFGEFVDLLPTEVLPVIQQVMLGAKSLVAVDGFRTYYRLKELRVKVDQLFRIMDLLLVPTAGTHYSLAEIEADPIRLNTNLGYYTNFVNLMDLSALAVPAGMRANGLPFGITCIAPAFREGFLTSIGAAFQEQTGLSLGATGNTLPVALPSSPSAMVSSVSPTMIPVAVLGLHLSGQPLNGELLDLGARLVSKGKTAACYRLYALERGDRKFPGMVRHVQGGDKIELEVWELTPAAMGTFLGKVREPLCIGTVELESGEKIKGFLCEGSGVGDARDITRFGGWRAYLGS